MLQQRLGSRALLPLASAEASFPTVPQRPRPGREAHRNLSLHPRSVLSALPRSRVGSTQLCVDLPSVCDDMPFQFGRIEVPCFSIARVATVSLDKAAVDAV